MIYIVFTGFEIWMPIPSQQPDNKTRDITGQGEINPTPVGAIPTTRAWTQTGHATTRTHTGHPVCKRKDNRVTTNKQSTARAVSS
jgi:hypothetical protein